MAEIFECCWRFQITDEYENDCGKFSDFYQVEADHHKHAAELFADHAHHNLGMWEYGNEWDGLRAVAARRKGETDFHFFNIGRVAIPQFTATLTN